GVRDVEVRVARGQALAVEIQRRGHGQRDNLDPRAILEPHALESFPVFLEWPVVRIARIILSSEDHGPRPDEPADIIYVAVRVVARDSLPQPQHVGHAKVLAEDAFEILPAEPGVPRLRGLVKQALFGGHERPAAVDVDAAAFEAHVASPLGAGAGAKQAQLERLRHALGYGVALTPVRILGP